MEIISEEKEEHCGVVLCGKLQPPTSRCGIQSFKGGRYLLAWLLRGTEVYVGVVDKFGDFDIQLLSERRNRLLTKVG